MFIVISPAKTLDFESPANTTVHSQPDFLDRSQQLIEQLRQLSAPEISELMNISPQLGDLNFQRYLNWHTPFTSNNAKQAVLAFKGDVYTGLQAETFSTRQLDFAQQHLRILSGLYGVLRPLDLMQAYRLEMGTRLHVKRTGQTSAKNLYEFWGDLLTESINQQMTTAGQCVLVNLASNEYFKALKPKLLQARIVTPVFKDLKNGQYKVVSFYAKKARGMMAAHIIKKGLKDVEKLKGAELAGYRYNASLSKNNEWVFSRDEAV